MHISFTGTRKGLSPFQRDQLVAWLMENGGQVSTMAHGCCTGADIEAAGLFRKYAPTAYFLIYPSTAATRAEAPPYPGHVFDPKQPLARNKDILLAGRDLLIAAPFELSETLRSGTWSTIRMARKLKVPIHFLWRS